MKFNLKDFLTDPAHKERRDFLSGVIDARIKELIAERQKSRNAPPDDPEENKNKKTAGNIFDDIFGGNDDE